MEVALNIQRLFVVGARPYLAIQNVKYDSFRCAFRMFSIFAGSVFDLGRLHRYGNINAIDDISYEIWQLCPQKGMVGHMHNSFIVFSMWLSYSVLVRPSRDFPKIER